MARGIDTWFAPTVYWEDIEGDEFDLIQNEYLKNKDAIFLDAVPMDADGESVKSTNRDVGPAMHRYGLDNLGRVVNDRLREYLEMIGWGFEPPRNLELHRAWFSCYQKGDYMSIHKHGCAFSGVYIYDGAEDDGDTVFESTVKLMGNSNGYFSQGSRWTHTRAHYKPKPGRLLLFPGWFMHSVSQLKTNHPRVSISLNWGVV